MTTTWTPAVWQAIDVLANLDLANYSKHVFDREAFLGTARRKRAEQHRSTIDGLLAANPGVTCDELVNACNPQAKTKPDPQASTAAAWAVKAAENDRKRLEDPLPPPPPACSTCTSTGLTGSGFCGCERGRARLLIHRMITREAS